MTEDKNAVKPAEAGEEGSAGRALLGPAPLLAGEDATAYESLLSHCRRAVRPKDFVEEIWVRDIVDLQWEAMRCRRMVLELMRSKARDGLDQVLRPYLDQPMRSQLVKRWAAGDREAIRIVDGHLKRVGLEKRVISEQTALLQLDELERLERMIAQAEGRRNAILREIERHRAAVAQRLAQATREIKDAEFTEIAPPQEAAA